MARLKSREHQIPGGFKFRQEELKWDSLVTVGLHPSFRRLVDAVMAMRRANQWMGQQKGWRTSRFDVETEVEQYNVKICQDHNWNQYLIDGDPVPKTQAHPHGLARVAVGVETSADWLGAGGKPVEKEKAIGRGAVCVVCPKNAKGDWTRFFTVPVSGMIRRYIEAKNAMKLATPHDEQLGICEACACPMKVKVWTPLSHITEHLSAETKADLHPDCWILKEMNQ
jgi:hypothetical protein